MGWISAMSAGEHWIDFPYDELYDETAREFKASKELFRYKHHGYVCWYLIRKNTLY